MGILRWSARRTTAGGLALGLLAALGVSAPMWTATAQAAPLSRPCGGASVQGAIADLYYGKPGLRGTLGCPTTSETAGPEGTRYNWFERGGIIWHPSTGAHEIHGSIYHRYRFQHGGFQANLRVLGWPVTDERPTPTRPGAYNHFSKGGSIYHSTELGRTHAVYGAIRAHWELNGWEAGRFGFPLEEENQQGPYRAQHFEFCSIWWSVKQVRYQVAPPARGSCPRRG